MKANKFLRLHIFSLILLSACGKSQRGATSNIINTFSIADGFQIELVAREPLISDPVAMEIDENGDVYIVEMPGYPLDLSGSGVVKKLYDDDEDGVFDRSEIFYDGLILPTGIMRWKQGVLVTDPPDLLYLEDTDGDNKADKKEVILTGFALSNPQHNFNSPIYGLDNWIYLANEETYKSRGFGHLFGDEGQEIYFPDHPDAPRLPKNANDVNVKVNLHTSQLEMLAGDSQYGHTFNQWGHHFLTKNWSHIYHEVIESKYITRNEDLVIPSAMQYVPDYGIGFDIYPITENPRHQMLTDVGVITSACGITWYLGDLFPEPYGQVIFTAEPTHNLVHTDILYHQGATFGSRKQFESTEFLASTDGWFRPVNFYIGPDGSLFLLDYYRKIIEHPEWMSEEVINSGELYAGIDQGRIFRIIPEENRLAGNGIHTHTHTQTQTPMLGQASPEVLIQYLEHQNIWWRRHAQRLLVDRQQPGSIPELKEFISTAGALGTLHGLWTLEGLGHFDKRLVLAALDHEEAGVRQNAIKIGEMHRHEFPEFEEKLISMTRDADSKVRFQLLCTLGSYESDASARAREDLLFQDVEDPWVQLAALSAKSVGLLAVFREAAARMGTQPSSGARQLFSNLSKTLGKTGDANAINQMLNTIISERSSTENTWWRSAAMDGLAETVPPGLTAELSVESLRILEQYFDEKADPELRAASIKLLNTLGYLKKPGALPAKAKQVVNNSTLDQNYRSDAVRVLAWADAEGNSGLFQQLLMDEGSSQVRNALLDAFNQTTGPEECRFLIDHWTSLSHHERDQALDVFTSSDSRRIILLQAVKSGQINSSAIGWSGTVGLLNSRNDQVRNLAREVLQGNESIPGANSDSVWQDYQQVLTLTGDPGDGAAVYERSCALCHQVSGMNGIAYGPDLAAVRNRSKSGIMMDILKPNRSISDGFDLWTIQDKSNNHYSGMIVDQNANTVRLRNASGEDVLIQQTDIVSKTAAEISAMPEGLHLQISLQEMADLLEYLKSGGAAN